MQVSKRMLQIFYMKNRKNMYFIANITKYFKMRILVRVIFFALNLLCYNGRGK